jgi:hypothetical protein
MYNFTLLQAVWESKESYFLFTWKGKVVLARTPSQISFKKDIDNICFGNLTIKEAMSYNQVGIKNHITLNSDQLSSSIEIPLSEGKDFYALDVPVHKFMKATRDVESNNIDEYIEITFSIKNEK